MIKSIIHFGCEDIPVVATAIHHGHDLPPELEESCGISPAQRLREEDPYTGLIAAQYPNHIVVHTSRFAVDLNRREDKCVYRLPDDCWGLPVRKTPLAAGLVEELHSAYRDWYALLAFQVERMLRKHRYLIVLDLHSYNHRRHGINHPPEAQQENPDINLGSSNIPRDQLFYLMRLQEMLKDSDPTLGFLDCRTDIKFTGGHLVRWLHQMYPHRVIAPAVEFKKFFMDEWTGVLDESCFQRLSAEFIGLSRSWADETLDRLNGRSHE
ncbi:MAG: N-formylglutamate amidohydrolase [Candidatus Cloacimonetes bacterium]|nr:N-formylglutamate amidohydrolase [Candidatus Cloacimonadota bacterium]